MITTACETQTTYPKLRELFAKWQLEDLSEPVIRMPEQDRIEVQPSLHRRETLGINAADKIWGDYRACIY